ncbi:MAG: PAS domain-containing protein [Acidobacteriota bacterium]
MTTDRRSGSRLSRRAWEASSAGSGPPGVSEDLSTTSDIPWPSDGAVVVVDNDLRVTYWSAAATDLYGLARQDAIGHRLGELYEIRWDHPDDERDAYQALAARGAVSGRNRHVLRSGRELRVEWSVRVLRENGGHQRGLIAGIQPVEPG